MTSTPLTSKNRPFAAFDIDGTLIRWQLYHSIADTLARLGHIEPKLHKTIKDARMIWKNRSGEFSDYERQLIDIYDKTIIRLERRQFEDAAQAVFDEYKDQVYTYTRDLIAELKKKNYLLFAVSGSQAEIVAKIAGYYGFDDYIGSSYKYKNGRFTGEKQIAAHRKDKALTQLVRKHSVTFKGSIAVGDSQSDIAMLEMVEQAIAFNPEKQLFTYAASKGWKIVVERKNMVYQLIRKGGDYELAETN